MLCNHAPRKSTPARFPFTLAGLLLMLPVLALLTGCGGGTLALTGPVVGSPTITTVPTPLTAAGGTANVLVHIRSDSLLDVTSNPPKIDVKNSAGVSLLGGSQLLSSLNSDPTAWAFQFNVPANSTSSTVVYQVTIYAQSIGGGTGNTPYNAGGLIVPHP